MTILQAQAGTGRYLVEAVVTICGADLNICVGGGSDPHVGACALAIPRPSLRDQTKNSASVSVLTVTGHMEDELARQAAFRLASILGGRVSVSVGLHIDNADADEIKWLESNFMTVLTDVENQVLKVLGKKASR